MRYLRQSTSADVPIGPFLDNVDGFTAETALTITQPDVRLKKGAAAWAQKAAAQTLTHEENGFYEVTLDATDTDTIGLMRLAVFETGALPVWEDFHVLAANVYDSLFGAATDKLQVDVIELASDAQSATDLKDFADAGYDPATNKVQGVVLLDTVGTGGIVAGSFGAAAIDAAAIATDAFGALELAAGAGSEIAAAVRTELTTELARIDAAVSTRLATAGYTVPPTAIENADALLDRSAGVETGFTPRQAYRLILSAVCGKSSGHESNAPKYRDMADTINRIDAVTDVNGNRTTVTRDTT